MIILIKHKKPIIGKGKGFSIVDRKISYMKGIGQSLSRLSTMVQHNKETVFYKEKDIIRNL